MGETVAHLTHKALTGIDITIIAVYFVIIFAIGFYFARPDETTALLARSPLKDAALAQIGDLGQLALELAVAS